MLVDVNGKEKMAGKLFNEMSVLDKEKALVPLIIDVLQKAGGQLDRLQIRERICADNDEIADWANEIRISKKTNKGWSEFVWKFNFALKNLMIAGFLEYHRGNPTVVLTKKGLDVRLDEFDTERDVYGVTAPYWRENRGKKIIEKEDSSEQQEEDDDFRIKLLSAIKNMSPRKFEMFSRQLFGKMGIEFTNIGVQISNDGGIDGLGYHRDLEDFRTTRVVIQCKRYNNGAVGSQEIDMFLGAMSKFQADYGIFITSSRFTTAAIDASRSGKPITLIDGSDLVKLVIKYQLHIKPVTTYELLEFYDEE